MTGNKCTCLKQIYSNSKVKQLFTAMHGCSNFSKLLPQNDYRWKEGLFNWSTCIKHALSLTRTVCRVKDTREACPMYVKITRFASEIIQFMSLATDATRWHF